MSPTGRPNKNRRVTRRHSAKTSAQVVCYANSLGLGANVALTLLDVSERGARLTVSRPLPAGNEVTINFGAVGRGRPIRLGARVTWCLCVGGDVYEVGVQFHHGLTYRDLLELGQ